MPSNRRLQSPPGRTGSLARGSYNFRKRSLRRSHCELGGVLSEDEGEFKETHTEEESKTFAHERTHTAHSPLSIPIQPPSPSEVRPSHLSKSISLFYRAVKFIITRSKETSINRAKAHVDESSTAYLNRGGNVERVESTILPSIYTLPICGFELRASHARKLLPAALACVSFGFVLVRVRVRVRRGDKAVKFRAATATSVRPVCPCLQGIY